MRAEVWFGGLPERPFAVTIENHPGTFEFLNRHALVARVATAARLARGARQQLKGYAACAKPCPRSSSLSRMMSIG
jgi:hypothetical protein